jgi:hypothetical protein
MRAAGGSILALVLFSAHASASPLAGANSFTLHLQSIDSSFFRVQQRCCKICSKGKACGDSCISATKTCRAGLGCACNK